MARILVICGGDNLERRVSLASGDAVAKGLAAAGHEVLKIDSSYPGNIVDPGTPLLDGIVGPVPPEELKSVTMNPVTWQNLIDNVVKGDYDAIFPILHGSWGEDGRIQAVLELLNIPYLGSGVLSSQLCMNKEYAKKIAIEHGLPVAPGFNADKNMSFDDIICRCITDLQLEEQLGGSKIVVKPLSSGSAVDVYIVENKTEILEAVNKINENGDEILIEKFIPGKELTVTVLDDQGLPVIEIAPKTGFYDYTRKYTKGETEYLCPAPVDEKIATIIRNDSLKVFQALECRHVARVDWRYDPADNNMAFLEVNTMPGMTDLSLVPMAAKEVGIDFSALMDRFVQMVLEGKAG